MSTRHLSFVETGRSQPSREMVIHLAEHLNIPLRDQNALLLAAGYAPAYGSAEIDDPQMAPVRAALDLIISAHEPNPAVVLDRHWNIVLANEGAGVLLADVADHVLEPVPNVMRIALHPDGLAPRIVNLNEVREHLTQRLRRQHAITGDPVIADLIDELAGPGDASEASWQRDIDVVLPVTLVTDGGPVSFFSTLTTFGSPLDVTVSELTVELFFPMPDA